MYIVYMVNPMLMLAVSLLGVYWFVPVPDSFLKPDAGARPLCVTREYVGGDLSLF